MRLERADALPSIVIRELGGGERARHRLRRGGLFARHRRRLRVRHHDPALRLFVDDDAVGGLRLRHGEPRRARLRKRQEIPSGHDPADYVTTRIMATSHDGAKVPVSILHRRDLERDGKAPLLLYGYGSYGIAMPASFSANRLSLVDRGFVYAIAHVRGGADKGWGWYLDGKREKKTNTFDDFAAAGARADRGELHHRAKRIVGHGGSAGGMLMGAVANRAGDLFAGIIAEVPFVDVLNTMLDDTLPLTPPEWPEWGNPIDRRDGLPHHPLLLALRQRRGEGLSGDPGDGRPDRSARDLLGAGEMGRAAARDHDRRRPGAAAHQHGRGPRRRIRPLRPPRRGGDRLCVRAVGGGLAEEAEA